MDHGDHVLNVRPIPEDASLTMFVANSGCRAGERGTDSHHPSVGCGVSILPSAGPFTPLTIRVTNDPRSLLRTHPPGLAVRNLCSSRRLSKGPGSKVSKDLPFPFSALGVFGVLCR
jgi:hypothetical protein